MGSKNIVLTGGTRGIGEEILKCLSKVNGYHFHVIARNISEIDKLKSEIPNSDFYSVDLSNVEEITEFVQKLSGVDIYGIINNAGICKTAPLESDSNVFMEVLNTNLVGPFELTKRLSNQIVDNGRIVNISSQLGIEGRAGYGAYCSSKFALIGLTKCWAKELGYRGVTVNAVCPGWVDTEMSRIDLKRIADEKGITAEDFYKEICAPLELKRFSKPSEVANLVSFLMSPEASGITGRDWLLNTIWNQE